MKKIYLFILIIGMVQLSSCVDDYDDNLVPLAGIYDASITGSFVAFDMGVTITNGDYIQVEAPFDGFAWTLADVEVRNKNSDVKNLRIEGQYIDLETYISGDGFYSDGNIQLDYTIEDPFGTTFFQIIATKF